MKIYFFLTELWLNKKNEFYNYNYNILLKFNKDLFKVLIYLIIILKLN